MIRIWLKRLITAVMLSPMLGFGAVAPSSYMPVITQYLLSSSSRVKVELGGDKVLGEDQVTELSASIENIEDVVSYEWSENGRVLGTQSTFSTAGLSVGVHRITLTVIDKNGVRISDTFTIRIEDGIDEYDLNHDTRFIGTLKGTFAVEQGTSTYRIPIDVPPGIAGMEPKLSLMYASTAGNGVMGMGWDIAGVSVITRCAQTKAIDGDGHVFGIHYDGRDRFCLDGQRLIAVRGEYGAYGTEYRTLKNNYTKIISHGSAGGGPAWFEVRTKSGLIYRYGSRNDASLFTHNGAKRFWNVSHIEDSYGNGIDFHYHADAASGEHHLASVTYADNRIDFSYESRDDIRTGFTDGMPVSVMKRLSTIVVKTGETFVRRYDIAYTPESSGSKRSRIESITEHTADGDTAPLSIEWKDSESYGFLSSDISPPFSSMHVNDDPLASAGVRDDKGMQIVDINGDGLPDLIQLYIDSDGRQIRRVCLHEADRITCDNTYTSSGMPGALFVDEQGKSLGTRLADINGDGLIDIIQLYKPNGNYYQGLPQRHVWINTGSRFVSYTHDDTLPDAYFAGPEGKDMGTRLADINGDGFVDLIQLYIPQVGEYGAVPQRRVYLGSASGFAYDSGYSHSIADLYFSQGEGRDMGTRLADINGDGLPDLIQLYLPDNRYYGGNIQARVMLNTGSGFTMSQSYRFPDAYFADAQGRDMGTRLADINGDGLPDLIQLYDATSYYGGVNQAKVYLNTGKTFDYSSRYTSSLFGQALFFSNEEGRQRGTRLADINGDGLVDIIQLYLPSGGEGQRRVFLNTGKEFEEESSYIYGLDDLYFNDYDGLDMGTRLADVNGDGLCDVVQIFTPSNSVYYGGAPQHRVYLNTNNRMLMNEIDNDADEHIEIDYRSMTSGSVYYNYSVHGSRNLLSFNKIADGNIEITPAMPVVASTLQNNGAGGLNRTRYRYYGYVVNKLWGAQGFHAVKVDDDTHNSMMVTYYKQIGMRNGEGDAEGFSYTGMPYLIDIMKNNESGMPVLLEHTSLLYRNASSCACVAEPYAYSETHTVYDPDTNDALYRDLKTTQMSSDGLGNVLRVTQKRTDLLSGRSKQTDTVNRYDSEDVNA